MSCPICAKETNKAFRQFCSKRCTDIDLGRWINGNYAIPSSDPEDIEKAIEEVEQHIGKPH